MHDHNLIWWTRLCNIDHDLLKHREENLNKLIQGPSFIINHIFVGLEDFLECKQPRNELVLIIYWLLQTISDLVDRVLPIFREINLGNIKDDTLESTPIDNVKKICIHTWWFCLELHQEQQKCYLSRTSYRRKLGAKHRLSFANAFYWNRYSLFQHLLPNSVESSVLRTKLLESIHR